MGSARTPSVAPATRVFKDAASFALLDDAAKAAAELDPLEAQLAQARTRSDNLALAFADGGEIASLRRLLDATETEIAGLRMRLATLSAKVAAEATMDDNVFSREGELYSHPRSEDEGHRFKMRELFNARLRRFVDRMVVVEAGDAIATYFKEGANLILEIVGEPVDPRTWEEFLADEARYEDKTAAVALELGVVWLAGAGRVRIRSERRRRAGASGPGTGRMAAHWTPTPAGATGAVRRSAPRKVECPRRSSKTAAGCCVTSPTAWRFPSAQDVCPEQGACGARRQARPPVVVKPSGNGTSRRHCRRSEPPPRQRASPSGS